MFFDLKAAPPRVVFAPQDGSGSGAYWGPGERFVLYPLEVSTSWAALDLERGGSVRLGSEFLFWDEPIFADDHRVLARADDGLYAYDLAARKGSRIASDVLSFFAIPGTRASFVVNTGQWSGSSGIHRGVIHRITLKE
jgi:hypothetical protein